MIKNIFLFCSGANRSVLEECPSEETKYVGIGATIFFTAVLAGLSGGYALYTVFLSYGVAIPFGLLWALMIFNLDRVIISGMRKQKAFRLDLLSAAPRFLLATLLAVVISRPLELKLFEREIQAQMAQANIMAYQRTVQTVDAAFGALTTLETRNKSLENERSTKQKELDQVTQEWIQEVEGTGGTRIPGRGPVFREKEIRLNEFKRQLENLEKRNDPLIAQNLQEIKKLKEDREIQIKQASEAQKLADGFLARIEAFSQLSDSSWAMSLASLFITLLFIVLETSPVAVKLLATLSPYRPYDQKLEDLELEVVEKSEHQRELLRNQLITARKKEFSDRNNVLDTEMEISSQKSKQRLEAELQANRTLMHHIAEAQTTIAERIVDKWKTQEMEKIDDGPTDYISVS
jgi:Domain of unknown function (DUF4407)